jgi:hypothetical protein
MLVMALPFRLVGEPHTDYADAIQNHYSTDFGRPTPPDYTDAIRVRCRLMGCKTTTSIFEADLLAQPKDPHEPATVSPTKGLPSA